MAGNHHSERKGIGLQETDELIPVPLYKENTFNLVKSTSWEPRGRGWQWHLWSLSRHEGSGEKCIKIWRVQMMAHILQSMKYPVTGPWLLNSPPKSPHWPRNVLKNTVLFNAIFMKKEEISVKPIIDTIYLLQCTCKYLFLIICDISEGKCQILIGLRCELSWHIRRGSVCGVLFVIFQIGIAFS